MAEDYGLLTYSSMNIGDEIQSIAAARFLPRIDHYVPREQVDSFRAERRTKLIMNAWWMWRPKHFPPSPDIDPLLLSVHLRKGAHDRLVTGKAKNYLVEHGPVGCRDQRTLELLSEHGIPGYLSGCLTLTLPRDPGVVRRDYVLAVDCPAEVVAELRRRTRRPVYPLTRILSVAFTAKQRLDVARLFLRLFQSAHLVVSPCLHVTLPSLALGTPVLRIDDGDGDMDAYARFAGIEHLLHTRTVGEFLADPDAYDLDDPPANPTAYLAMREELVRVAAGFTGCDAGDEAAPDDTDPLVRFFELLGYDRDIVHRAAWWARPDKLLWITMQLLSRRRSRYDLRY